MGDPRTLEVWKRARRLSVRVHQLLRKLPDEELAVRGDQLARASSSIPYNISEGKGRDSDPELAKHLKYSLGSASELHDQLDELHELELLPDEDFELIGEADEVRRMVAGLRLTVLRDIQRAKKSRKKRRGGCRRALRIAKALSC